MNYIQINFINAMACSDHHRQHGRGKCQGGGGGGVQGFPNSQMVESNVLVIMNNR